MPRYTPNIGTQLRLGAFINAFIPSLNNVPDSSIIFASIRFRKGRVDRYFVDLAEITLEQLSDYTLKQCFYASIVQIEGFIMNSGTSGQSPEYAPAFTIFRTNLSRHFLSGSRFSRVEPRFRRCQPLLK